MPIYYKVNIDYIKKDNLWLASYPEIPVLTATGVSHSGALTALEVKYNAFTGYLPMPLSFTVTY